VVKVCDCFDRFDDMATPAPMIAEHAPVLQPCDRMLDACTALAMAAPGSIADDPVVTKDGCDQLADTAVAAVGEHSSVVPTPRLDIRRSIVDHVVTIAGSAARDSDDAEVGAPDDQLYVAGPSIVLRLGGRAMIARGDERSIDDPCAAVIAIGGVLEARRELRRQVGEDAMRLGLRDREDRCELADGQVGP
jgi:hypothetical protein